MQQPAFIALDGASTRDIDDAFWLTRHEDGFSLQIAIAQVAACVSAGSDLDQQARAQAETVYAGTRVRQAMLPVAISEAQGSDAGCRSTGLPRTDRERACFIAKWHSASTRRRLLGGTARPSGRPGRWPPGRRWRGWPKKPGNRGRKGPCPIECYRYVMVSILAPCTS